jgi:hypothetical protein
MASGHAESSTYECQTASFENLAGQVAPWASKPATSRVLDHLDSEKTSVLTQAEQEQLEQRRRRQQLQRRRTLETFSELV